MERITSYHTSRRVRSDKTDVWWPRFAIPCLVRCAETCRRQQRHLRSSSSSHTFTDVHGWRHDITGNRRWRSRRDHRIELLGKAGFKTWSNSSKVLQGVPVEDRVANVDIEESELPCIKALGVQWNAEVNVFTFLLKLPHDIECTKRGFLKKLATLFDPLQMLTLFTVRARMAMQETWLLGWGWDDEFPDELSKKCQEWSCELPELSCVEVPRCYRVTGQRVVDTSMHTMTDASQLAYAAVIYVLALIWRWSNNRRIVFIVAVDVTCGFFPAKKRISITQKSPFINKYWVHYSWEGGPPRPITDSRFSIFSSVRSRYLSK